MSSRPDVPPDVIQAVRAVCCAFPEVVEEPAWIGLRWRIRTHTFAHVLTIADGSPASYAKAAGTDGPVTVLTFRAEGEDLHALANAGPPYFAAQWGRPVGGLRLDGDVDWREVGELLTESYCLLAPKRLRDQVDRPPL
jgi:hypothetical protein